MKTIALWGKANTGKTTTFKKMREKFLNNNQIVKVLYDESNFAIVYKIKEKYVCITSSGDTRKILEDIYNEVKEFKCDIFVSASRTKGETVKFLKEISNNNVCWIKKEVSDSNVGQQIANENDATKLYNQLDIYLNN